MLRKSEYEWLLSLPDKELTDISRRQLAAYNRRQVYIKKHRKQNRIKHALQLKTWRKQNIEKCRAYDRKAYANNTEKFKAIARLPQYKERRREAVKKHYKINAKKINAKMKKCIENNTEKWRAWRRKSYLKNREKYLAATKRWRRNNESWIREYGYEQRYGKDKELIDLALTIRNTKKEIRDEIKKRGY